MRKIFILLFIGSLLFAGDNQLQLLITESDGVWLTNTVQADPASYPARVPLDQFGLSITSQTSWLNALNGFTYIETKPVSSLFDRSYLPGDLFTLYLSDRDEAIAQLQYISMENGLIHCKNDQGEFTIPVSKVDFIMSSAGEKILPLNAVIVNKDKRKEPVNIHYGFHSTGLSWRCEYDLIWLDEEKADVKQYYRLQNSANQSIQAHEILLLSGEINSAENRSRDNSYRSGREPKMYMAMEMGAVSAPESSDDFYLYRIDNPVEIPANGEIRLAMNDGYTVKPRREYRITGSERSSGIGNAQSFIRLINSKEDGLGQILPKGILRNFSNQGIFSGSTSIKSTAVGDTLEFSIGKAFDISYERTVTAYDHNRSSESVTIRYTLKNGSKSAKPLIVTDQVWGEWDLTKSNFPGQRISADQIQFNVNAAANSEVILTYSYQKRFK